MKKLTFVLAGGVAAALSLQSCQNNVETDNTAVVDSLVNVRMVSVIDSMNNACLLRIDSAQRAWMDSMNISASTTTTTTTVRKSTSKGTGTKTPDVKTTDPTKERNTEGGQKERNIDTKKTDVENQKKRNN